MTELRLVPDRRQNARGGRRADDRDGYAPMVVVIDVDATRLDISEAILAKLRFAVAPFDSVDKALAAMRALRPEIIVAREDAAKELRGRIQQAVDELPEIYRTVFIIRDVEGLSTEETAEVLQISVPTVKTRLHRAHQALRTLLAPLFGD